MQRDRTGRTAHDSRARLLAGVAMIACATGLPAAAWGQARPDQGVAATAVPDPSDDGLGEGGIYLEADVAARDPETDVLTAEGITGPILARHRDRTLLARRLSYDMDDGLGAAEGSVELIDPDGMHIFASRIELDDQFRAGIAVDFAARFENGASLMAATAVRRTESVSELNYALFTPCPICDEEGRPKTPSISIQAEQVVQDADLRAVLYRNALFRIGGVPVLWLPVFAHPDPTVERASGLLVPRINYDDGRGFSWEQPYLIVVSPSEDWLISPQINTRAPPFLNAQWRRRFADGTIVARAGYTYARNFDDDGGFGDREHRSYILAQGAFDPAGPWRWGFTAERTSDRTLFDRYDIQDPYQDNGLYYGDRRRLISQLYSERQTERTYLSIAAFAFQSLRVAEFDLDNPVNNVFEDGDTLPYVAPLIEARWEPINRLFGGRVRFEGSAVSLYREAYVGSPVLGLGALPPVGAPDLHGVDSRRISGRVHWRRSITSVAGVRWEPFVDVRADVYSVSDLPPALGLDDGQISRVRASAGLDVSWPLIRRFRNGSDIVLEPLAQLSLTNNAKLDPRIPIEDSHVVELDQASLFRTDRFSGADLYEGGLRISAGARATWQWGTGRFASLFVGRSFRDSEEEGFLRPIPDLPTETYDPTGLASENSDWVVQTEFRPQERVRGWGHAQIDGNGDIRRAEASLDVGWGRRNFAGVTYIVDRSNPFFQAPVDPDEALPLNRNYEFVQMTAQQFVWGNWGFTASGVTDLDRDRYQRPGGEDPGAIVRSEIGLLFDDDCFRVEIGYRRDNTRVRPGGPSDGIYLRLNLATFGGSTYQPRSVW